jgi:molybdopterin-guanine dinucleotide biosynthesis protein A
MPGMSDREARPIGVVLAGGLGRRLGGPKATVRLHGRPLISYPVRALRQAVGKVVVVAKADTELPRMSGVEVWIEPDVPRHPLCGLVHALRLAGGSSIVVCACDLPMVTPDLVREVVAADPGGAAAVITRAAGRLQPLMGRYEPAALGPLAMALGDEAVPVNDAVAALGPRVLDIADPDLLFNVNAPEDLLHACALLSGPPRSTGARRSEDQPNVKS